MNIQSAVKLAVASIVFGASCIYAADEPQIMELELNKPLNLRQLNGPNVDLIVNEVDISDVVITLVDYDRMQVGGWGNDSLGYHASSAPTRTRTRVKKANGALLFMAGRIKILYIDDMSTSINHVKLGIVSD